MRRLHLAGTVVAAMILNLLRDRPVRLGLILLPVGAVLVIGFYKVLLSQGTDLLPDVFAPRIATVVVDTGVLLPGLAIPAAEAKARLERHPWFDVEIAAAVPDTARLLDQELDLIVMPAPDGADRTLIRLRGDWRRVGNVARDLLRLPPPGTGATAAGATAAGAVDVVIRQAPPQAGSELLRLAPLFVVLVVTGTGLALGANAFVTALRKGQFRHLSVLPVGQGLVLGGHLAAVCLLTAVQASVVAAVLALYGDVRSFEPLGYFAAILGATGISLGIGFAALSFQPAQSEKGAPFYNMALTILAVVANSMIVAHDREDTGLSLAILLNPMGPPLDLMNAALTGLSGVNPAGLNLLAMSGWVLLGTVIAWLRMRFSLDPDWSRR